MTTNPLRADALRERLRDAIAAALVTLAEHNVPADTQEMLLAGNKDVKPGALNAVVKALLTPPPNLASVVAEIGQLYKNPTTFYAEGFNDALDVISEKIEARTALTSGTGWLPIESAPKDGSGFTAYWPDHENGGGQWGAEQATTWVTPDGRFLSNSGVLDDFFPEDWNPTHWKPLDPPPLPQPKTGDA